VSGRKPTRGSKFRRFSIRRSLTTDGELYGYFEIKRNGNELILNDGKCVMRLKYYSLFKC
jgi:hypothetical protein